MKITFTGHRPNKIKDSEYELEQLIATFNFHKIPVKATFIVGGCPGFDTIVLDFLLNRIAANQIKIYVPFKGFEKYATKDMRNNSEAINLNNKAIYGGAILEEKGGSGTFAKKCWNRNYAMCKDSELLITNWDGSKGGTANTVKIAQKLGLKIINIHDK